VVEEVLSALSLLGQEQRNTALEGKAGRSWDLNTGEDTSAPASYKAEHTPCQIHAVTLRKSWK